jgi:hypothetical protein
MKLQRLLKNVNTIPPTNMPQASADDAAKRAGQQNLPEMATNFEDVELEDQIMEIVQQTQTIVDEVQAIADSMAKRKSLVAKIAPSAPGDPPATPERDDGAVGPKDTTIDSV